jgi:hypothetical protein
MYPNGIEGMKFMLAYVKGEALGRPAGRSDRHSTRSVAVDSSIIPFISRSDRYLPLACTESWILAAFVRVSTPVRGAVDYF